MSARRARAAQAGFGPDWLQARLAASISGRQAPPLAIALSGGSDSVALLVCAREAARGLKAPLRAIHVDHALQSASREFVRFCTDLCARLGIPLTVLPANVHIGRGDSVEARAREARYSAFAAELRDGELLLLAQHADDQLETVLLQLMRGAGVAGLSAMAERAPLGRGHLLRPLLAVRRAELEAYRRAQGIDALEDPMNADPRFDRNYLRQEIVPRLLARWPGATAAVGRSARHAAEAQSLLVELADQDLRAAADGTALDVAALRRLAQPRRRNVLRRGIARLGLPLPDSARLAELCGPLLQARADAQPSVAWPGARARRELDRLHLERAPSVGAGAGKAAEASAPVLDWDWTAQQALDGEIVRGVLTLEPDPHGPLDLTRLPSTLHVRTRQGGERLQPRRGGPRRSLKALLSEARLPHAERAALPLVYAGDRLVAVADRWLDASVQASTQSSRRGRLSWTPRLPSDRPMC